MAFHRWRILIDWGGNGQWDTTAGSDEDVTDDVISGIRASAGIDYGQVFPYAKAGRASFTLRNDHRRYSGYDTSNPLGSGLQRAVLIQVWCAANTAFGAGGTYLPIWGGVVDYVRYGTSPSDLDTAEIFCIGNLGGLNDADISVDLSDDSVAEIGETLAEAVWPNTRITSTGNAAFRYLMAGGRPQVEHYLRTSNSPTIPSYVYDGRALAGLRSLAQDTGSRLFEGPDGAVRLYSTAAQSSLESGAARFTLRHTTTATSASTYHVTSASPEIARRDVINRVNVSWTETRTTRYTSHRDYGAAESDWTSWPGEGDVEQGYHRPTLSGTTLEWNFPATLPRFERNDPTPGSTLLGVTGFQVRILTIAFDIDERDRGPEVAVKDGVTPFDSWLFALDGLQSVTVGTETTLRSMAHGHRFNWVRDSLSGQPNNMVVKMLVSAVSTHEYTIRIRLENLHPDVRTNPLPAIYMTSHRGWLWLVVEQWAVQGGAQVVTYTQTDTSSVASHGLQSYDAPVLWITSDAQARAYATRILNARSAPTSRYRVSYVLDQKSSLTDIPQVSDIVDLEYRGTTTKCWVDSARHDISRRRHLCELLLTPV